MIEAITTKLTQSKFRILKFSFLFGLLFSLIFFTNSEEYTTKVTLLPEFSNFSGLNNGTFGKLSKLAGLKLNDASGEAEAIRPDLYPDILKSSSFLRKLSKEQIEIEGEDYLIGDYFSSEVQGNKLIGFVFGLLPQNSEAKQPNEVVLSKKEYAVVKKLRKHIIVDFQDENGIISISVLTNNPFASQKTAEIVIQLLEEYVTEYRLERSISQLEFIRNQTSKAKTDFIVKQGELAVFIDENQFLSSKKYQVILENKELEINHLRERFYSLLEQQSQLEITISERKPVIKILDEPLAILKRSSTNPIINVILAAFLCTAGFCVYLIRDELKKYFSFEQW